MNPLFRLLPVLVFAGLALRLPATPLPQSGAAVPELAALDQAMQTFMLERGFRAGTLAVMREGRLIFSRGYGAGDPVNRTVVAPHTRMRIASVSKPFTAAAIRSLIREGKLSPQTKAFPYLGLKLPSPLADVRLQEITIEHLLRHEGGWDREQTFDPLFAEQRITQALRLGGAVTLQDITRFMLTQPLQFAPGERSAYSNYGYNVLGQIVEKASGLPYAAYVRKAICEPHGITTLEPAGTLPLANEIWYDDPAASQLNMAVRTASGGLVASAPDLCRFLQHYSLGSGHPRRSRRGTYYFFGSLPGTTALVMQLPQADLAVLFNKRRAHYIEDNQALRALLTRTLEDIQQWPGENAR